MIPMENQGRGGREVAFEKLWVKRGDMALFTLKILVEGVEKWLLKNCG